MRTRTAALCFGLLTIGMLVPIANAAPPAVLATLAARAAPTAAAGGVRPLPQRTNLPGPTAATPAPPTAVETARSATGLDPTSRAARFGPLLPDPASRAARFGQIPMSATERAERTLADGRRHLDDLRARLVSRSSGPSSERTPERMNETFADARQIRERQAMLDQQVQMAERLERYHNAKLAALEPTRMQQQAVDRLVKQDLVRSGLSRHEVNDRGQIVRRSGETLPTTRAEQRSINEIQAKARKQVGDRLERLRARSKDAAEKAVRAKSRSNEYFTKVKKVVPGQRTPFNLRPPPRGK